jgi:hypothetical protein
MVFLSGGGGGGGIYMYRIFFFIMRDIFRIIRRKYLQF